MLRRACSSDAHARPRNFILRSGAALIAAAISVCVAPATAAEAPPPPSPLEAFQAKEDLLFRVGYRLSAANSAFCDRTIMTSGLLLHDAESYGDPEAVRRHFGLTGDIAAQAVAPASPAAAAGLSRNSTILAIDGTEVATAWPTTDPRWKRVFDIRDTVDAALAAGSMEITWQSAGEARHSASLTGVPACATRFELTAGKSNAIADGKRVLVGENFVGLGYDEDLFAAAIAHEMAHNLMRHPQTFGEIGWKRSLVRLSERDADRLMPWLLSNAGYDPLAAARFMRQWGPKHGGWIFRKRTHDGWDERVAFIEAELPQIAAAQAKRPDGLADWSQNFVSELAPALAKR